MRLPDGVALQLLDQRNPSLTTPAARGVSVQHGHMAMGCIAYGFLHFRVDEHPFATLFRRSPGVSWVLTHSHISTDLRNFVQNPQLYRPKKSGCGWDLAAAHKVRCVGLEKTFRENHQKDDLPMVLRVESAFLPTIVLFENRAVSRGFRGGFQKDPDPWV